MDHNNYGNDGTSMGAVLGLFASYSTLFISIASAVTWMQMIALAFSIVASFYTIKKNKKGGK